MDSVLTAAQSILIYCLVCWALGFAYERLCPVPMGQKRDYKFAIRAPIYPVAVVLVPIYVVGAFLLLFAGYIAYESLICRDHRGGVI